MGFLPDPLVSVHSLGALAAQIDAHNTRLLTKRAHERSSGPSTKSWLDSQTASSPPGASSTGAELAQSAVKAKGSIGVSSSSARDSERSEPQDDGTECDQSRVQHKKSRAGAGHHAQSSAAQGASPANSISSMDSFERGIDLGNRVQRDHSQGGDAGEAPESAVIGVDRPEMNSTMRMSLHMLIANKINEFVAQAWLSPCLYHL